MDGLSFSTAEDGTVSFVWDGDGCVAGISRELVQQVVDAINGYRPVALAAGRFVTALVRPDRDALDAQTAAVERDASLHALVVAVLGTCPLCDPGTCPEARSDGPLRLPDPGRLAVH